MSKPNVLRVFIVDDHAVVRQGTRNMLNQNPDFLVVGESPGESDLMVSIEARQPDILLLDINLPGENGLQLLPKLRERFPSLKIVLFSAHSELPYIRKAQQFKAHGFLSKTIGETELYEALSQVGMMQNSFDTMLETTMVFSADIAKQLQETKSVSKENSLTGREYEILTHLSKGLSNQAIAKQLCLSVKTVDTHIANLMKKTSTNKRTQLLAYAYDNKLIW